MAFVTYQLVPLDKKPLVRPIGIGDVQCINTLSFTLTFSLLLMAYRLPLATMLGQKLPSMP